MLEFSLYSKGIGCKLNTLVRSFLSIKTSTTIQGLDVLTSHLVGACKVESNLVEELEEKFEGVD
jgi:hypothetical protein